MAYLTCGDWQVAEDAVLGALAKLYGRWHRVDNHEADARTAVVRAAIDETRRPWWRREQSHNHEALPDTVVSDETPGVDERLRLRAALDRLPVKLRAVLVLRFLEGLSVQQTAAALDWPEGTVKGYSSRGLEALRQILDEPIGGRPAYFLDGKGSRLVWEYAAGAFAELAIVLRGTPGIGHAQLRQIATAFRPSAPYPVTLPFHSSYVPADYRLVDVNIEVGPRPLWGATFVPTGAARAQPANPSHSLGAPVSLQLEMNPVQGDAGQSSPGGRDCSDVAPGNASAPPVVNSCTAFVLGGTYAMHVYHGPENEMVKVLNAMVPVPDPANRSTWLPMDHAFPPSALITGK